MERDVTSKKETNEVTKKEDNNDNGIEYLFRSTTLLITIIASATFLLLNVSYHDKLPFVTALCECTHTNPCPHRKTTIQQGEEEHDER